MWYATQRSVCEPTTRKSWIQVPTLAKMRIDAPVMVTVFHLAHGTLRKSGSQRGWVVRAEASARLMLGGEHPGFERPPILARMAACRCRANCAVEGPLENIGTAGALSARLPARFKCERRSGWPLMVARFYQGSTRAEHRRFAASSLARTNSAAAERTRGGATSTRSAGRARIGEPSAHALPRVGVFCTMRCALYFSSHTDAFYTNCSTPQRGCTHWSPPIWRRNAPPT